MKPRRSFSRWSEAATLAALLLMVLTPVSAQDEPRRPRRPLPPSEATMNSVAPLLERARAAIQANDFAGAYEAYGGALQRAPDGSPNYMEARRGFAEAGVKLAQQRRAQGQTEEARRILHEVLLRWPDYRPALELLATLEPKRRRRQGIVGDSGPRETPPPFIPDSGPRATPPRTIVAIPRDAVPPSAESPPVVREAPQRIKKPVVRVFFATDRLPSGAEGPSKYFGTQWNNDDDHLTTGFVDVSIPPTHEEGKVERPWSVWIFEWREDLQKHFVLTKLQVLPGDDFYSSLRQEYDRRARSERSALVFIHGFNVGFDEAAYRTAQLAYDLDFDGVPMMYSWPSQKKLLKYDGDRETVDWSSPHLQGFLERVARESGAERIHLVAHSMGNQLMTSALRAIGRQEDIQPMFENVIMAAPDVNTRIFTDQIWPEIKNAARRFTLYASSDDKALLASKEAKGPDDFDRLGEAGPKLVVIPGLDTIDATGIDTALLGHSYVNQCKPILDDLSLLVEKGLAPIERKLRDRKKGGLAYWAFPLGP